MPQDLRAEAGNFLKKEYLAKRINIERVQEIIVRLESALKTKPIQSQKAHYALAQAGTEYPEINTIIVNYLASL